MKTLRRWFVHIVSVDGIKYLRTDQTPVPADSLVRN
jgi:hypothetical protein